MRPDQETDMSTTTLQAAGEGRTEAGFSLIEVLIAIIVLVFGIVSVANLIVVAAANNMTANQGSAAVAVAVQEMELLKSMSFDAVPVGVTERIIGDNSTRPAPDEERGVAMVHVARNVVIASVDATGNPATLFITVTATPLSATNTGDVAIDPANPAPTRSQAVFTTFRTVEGQ